MQAACGTGFASFPDPFGAEETACFWRCGEAFPACGIGLGSGFPCGDLLFIPASFRWRPSGSPKPFAGRKLGNRVAFFEFCPSVSVGENQVGIRGGCFLEKGKFSFSEQESLLDLRLAGRRFPVAVAAGKGRFAAWVRRRVFKNMVR